MNHTVVHSFSLLFSNVGRGILARSMNEMGNHLFTNWWVYFWLYCKLLKQFKQPTPVCSFLNT